MKLPILCCWLLTLAGAIAAPQEAAAKIKVLLVTGGHGFEREPFLRVFQENPEITFVHAEHKKGPDAYEREDFLNYDAVVLYDMMKGAITEEQKARFLALFAKGVGLLVMHHAIVSYQDWPDYERIIGGRYPEEKGKSGVVTEEAGYEHDVDVPVTIVAKDHPITSGLKDFVINDEIYWGYRVHPDVTPLISTTHPKSGKPLAWARSEKQSRVVYLQLGHGPRAYGDPNYRELVARSIRWVGRR